MQLNWFTFFNKQKIFLTDLVSTLE